MHSFDFALYGFGLASLLTGLETLGLIYLGARRKAFDGGTPVAIITLLGSLSIGLGVQALHAWDTATLLLVLTPLITSVLYLFIGGAYYRWVEDMRPDPSNSISA